MAGNSTQNSVNSGGGPAAPGSTPSGQTFKRVHSGVATQARLPPGTNAWKQGSGSSLFQRGRAPQPQPPPHRRNRDVASERNIDLGFMRNTVLIDLKAACEFYAKGDVFCFLFDDLKLRENEVSTVYYHNLLYKLVVTFKQTDKYDQVCEQLETGVKWTAKNDVTVHGYPTSKQTVTFTIQGFNDHMSLVKIENFLRNYGKIVKMVQGKCQFENFQVSDGSLIVTMIKDKDKQIPDHLFISNGQQAGNMNDCLFIFGPGINRRCVLCLRPGHIGSYCSYADPTPVSLYPIIKDSGLSVSGSPAVGVNAAVDAVSDTSVAAVSDAATNAAILDGGPAAADTGLSTPTQASQAAAKATADNKASASAAKANGSKIADEKVNQHKKIKLNKPDDDVDDAGLKAADQAAPKGPATQTGLAAANTPRPATTTTPGQAADPLNGPTAPPPNVPDATPPNEPAAPLLNGPDAPPRPATPPPNELAPPPGPGATTTTTLAHDAPLQATTTVARLTIAESASGSRGDAAKTNGSIPAPNIGQVIKALKSLSETVPEPASHRPSSLPPHSNAQSDSDGEMDDITRYLADTPENQLGLEDPFKLVEKRKQRGRTDERGRRSSQQPDRSSSKRKMDKMDASQ